VRILVTDSPATRGPLFFSIDNTIDNTQAENVREADPDRSSLHAAINDLGQELVDTKNEEYP
jgi:hypothetical protein